MSDRDRLLVAAAAIGVIVCALLWSVIGVGLLTRNPESAAAQYDIQQERDRTQYEAERAVRALTDEACADARAARDDDPQQANKRDLCAQYIAAGNSTHQNLFNYTSFSLC